VIQDPLQIIPLLLPCPDPAAEDIISLLGECSSPKEVVIAVQESIERISITLSSEQEETDRELVKPHTQLLRLVSLYGSGNPFSTKSFNYIR
jgi:hypothetical protein